jgi:hypothetical protein
MGVGDLGTEGGIVTEKAGREEKEEIEAETL